MKGIEEGRDRDCERQRVGGTKGGRDEKMDSMAQLGDG